jgi:DNA-binding NtrC family response regulator
LKQRIYIVDDEPKIGDLFAKTLNRDGYDARAFVSPNTMLEQVEDEEPPHLILTDLMMPSMNGIELMEHLEEEELQVPVIVMTAHSSVQNAVEAMQMGAFHYLQKPVNLEEMRSLIEKALALYEEEEEEQEEPDKPTPVESAKPSSEFPIGGILGESEAIEEVRGTIETLTGVPNTVVLLRGETGTGKNLVAKTIHHNSTYNAGRFMEINCAALPENLLEAELFGYEEGAFTDARESKQGLLEAADGGTLFLDEIDSMPVPLQAKLLSFLESRTFRRLGGVDEIRVTTRVLCATNSDLEQLVAEKEFRKDLFYRINVVNLHLPPLRKMGEDLFVIARSLVDEFNEELRRDVEGFTEAAREKLAEHAWPGNVRELRNVLERAMIFSETPEIEVGDLVLAPRDQLTDGAATGGRGSFSFPAEHTLEELEQAYILHTLNHSDVSYADVAEMLGISKKTLWEKRKRYNLDEQSNR